MEGAPQCQPLPRCEGAQREEHEDQHEEPLREIHRGHFRRHRAHDAQGPIETEDLGGAALLLLRLGAGGVVLLRLGAARGLGVGWPRGTRWVEIGDFLGPE